MCSLHLYCRLIFSGVGKLILAALSYQRKMLGFFVISDRHQQHRRETIVTTAESVLSAKLRTDAAADGVIGTALKRRIHRHLTNPDQRPRRKFFTSINDTGDKCIVGINVTGDY